VSHQLATVEKKLENVELQTQELREAQVKRDGWLLENAPPIKRLETLQRELWWREQQSAIAAEVAMPQYLLEAVGDRPGTPSERDAWRQSVKAVETHRARWNIKDQERALGDVARSGKLQTREAKEVRETLSPPARDPSTREPEVEPQGRSLER
jgi:hypothetical protein